MKRRRKWKKRILITLSVIAGIGALLSADALDDDTWYPAIILLICVAWLSLICVANTRE